jgi:threonine aldolase
VRTIDLRSDTVTLPTPAMRKAMYEAELGDDVYGEDPTVNRLEALVAEKLGKEAGLLVVSGTMGNLTALMTHAQRGDEVIMGHLSHTYLCEAGGISVLGGVHVRTVPNLPNGMIDPADVELAVRDPNNIHFPRSRVVCLENTHNRCGGVVLSPAQMATVREVARRHGLAVHLDGARIFNAAVALGIDASEIAAQVDSVQLCFSKGLSAPVGSAVVGSADYIKEVRRQRKIVGGAMRQAGIIAAAAIVALEEMVDRLAEDHENARVLAQGIKEIEGLDVDLDSVQSDIVMITLTASDVEITDLVKAFRAEGLMINNIDAGHFRAVTHYGIEREDISEALAILARVMKQVA